MTGDPAEVVADVLNSDGWRRLLPLPDPDVLAGDILTALAESGYAVVPAGETREEWAVHRDDGEIVRQRDRADAEATDEYESTADDGLGPCPPMRRTVHYGPWERVPDA